MRRFITWRPPSIERESMPDHESTLYMEHMPHGEWARSKHYFESTGHMGRTITRNFPFVVVYTIRCMQAKTFHVQRTGSLPARSEAIPATDPTSSIHETHNP